MHDVSHRVYHVLIADLERRGIDPACLCGNGAPPLSELRDPAGWSTWEQFVAVLNRYEAGAAEPHVAQHIARYFVADPMVAAAMRVLRLFVSPMALLEANARWAGPSVFPCIVERHERRGRDMFWMSLRIPGDRSDCPLYFDICREAFALLPKLIGAPAAQVSMTRGPRCAEYEIVTPPSRSLMARMRIAFQAVHAPQLLLEEVERQQQAFAQVRDQADAADRRARELLERLPDLVVHIDRQGMLTGANTPDTYAAALDLSVLVGVHMTEVAERAGLPAMAPVIATWWQVASQGGDPPLLEFPVVLPDGRTLAREVRTLRTAEGWAMIVRDTTDRLAREEQRIAATAAQVRAEVAETARADLEREIGQRRTLERLLRGHAEATAKLLAEGDFDVALSAVLATFASALDADRAFVYDVAPGDAGSDVTTFIRSKAWCRPGIRDLRDDPRYAQITSAFPGAAPWFAKYLTGQPVAAHVHDLPPALRRFYEEQDVQSLLLVPIPAAGRPTGFVGIEQCRHERTWTAHEIALVEALAASIGAAAVRRDAHRQLENARARAEAASALKDTILATLSHEIRTPMTAILGFAELLGRQLRGSKHEVHARMIEQSGKRLLLLLNNILDLARLKSDQMQMAPRIFPVHQATDRIAALYAALAAEKRINLVSQVDPNLTVWADPARVEQTLGNVVANAIRFTDDGSIVMSANTDTTHVTVSVSDSGCGIEPEALPYVFEEFRQGHGDPDHRRSGSGLGLAIVRRLMERMGGTVSIHSRVGHGTRVELRYPLTAEVATART